MKIKMLTGVAGTDFVLNRGEVTDRYEISQARRLIEAGLAVAVADEQDGELAKLRAENMVLRAQKSELDTLRTKHAATVAALAAATKPVQGGGT
ncbi:MULTISPECIES: hypothetical protein [Rhizobium/Agrobacterium group]|uniref:Uncharacterized protein n=1 Tax=Agrobacterium vitis TaxID=373 RepID=A0ABD6HCD7_AGRVI|nr:MULTISPECIES: hypothetical protein [Rhizobium/Agrobacterium group]MUO27702.1 hypothetical protein [Agrobacterium vitis]MUO44239.1 hypothetical protein [Agrobacterium vitis]MUP12313.1 hypothetical protein [Agrobacterium vitis]NSZ16594.1 hypothetical protein [Agrobacterium vitis]QZO05354.1 hypothetical protein K4831_07540 [Agrobacterium vitis]